MTIDNKIKDEKLQYDINREAAKTAVFSGKIDNYEYFTGKEISLPNQSSIIEQAKFTYFPLGKAFENEQKQLKNKEEKP